jgi:hypothetical protein
MTPDVGASKRLSTYEHLQEDEQAESPERHSNAQTARNNRQTKIRVS